VPGDPNMVLYQSPKTGSGPRSFKRDTSPTYIILEIMKVLDAFKHDKKNIVFSIADNRKSPRGHQERVANLLFPAERVRGREDDK
jgi:hypothetical protein